MSDLAQPQTSAPQSEREPGAGIAYGLAIVLAGVLFYALLHAGFRLLASNVLGEDDVVANVLAQELSLGYDTYPRQPPLYNWVLWLVQQALGPTLKSFLVIKYAALTATVGFLYLAARRILGSHIHAVLSVESLALIYSISWRFHEGFTHQVLAMAAVAATLYMFLRVLDEGRWRDFALFGVVVGLGLLTERVYAVFLGALVLAAVLQPGLRIRLLRRRVLVSIVIAALIAAPYLSWLFSDARYVADWLRPGAINSKDYWRGVIDAVRGPFFYLLPLAIFVPVMFPGFLVSARAKIMQPVDHSETGDTLQLLWHATFICFVASIVGALVLQLGRQPIHAYMALYVTTVIWLFGAVRDAEGSDGQLKRFAILALVVAAIALSARLANLYVMHPVCKKCRWGMPYVELGQEMQANGYRGEPIMTFDAELAGNLRQVFPKSKIAVVRPPAYLPGDVATAPRIYVWRERDGVKTAQYWFQSTLPTDVKAGQGLKLDIPWQHLWRDTGYHTTAWRMLRVEGAKGP